MANFQTVTICHIVQPIVISAMHGDYMVLHVVTWTDVETYSDRTCPWQKDNISIFIQLLYYKKKTFKVKVQTPQVFVAGLGRENQPPNYIVQLRWVKLAEEQQPVTDFVS